MSFHLVLCHGADTNPLSARGFSRPTRDEAGRDRGAGDGAEPEQQDQPWGLYGGVPGGMPRGYRVPDSASRRCVGGQLPLG